MQNVQNLMEDVEFPKFRKVTYEIRRDEIESVSEAMSKALMRPGTIDKITAGSSVAITAGSREISHMEEIIRCLVAALKQKGIRPFIFPAMGSHGGATAEGQKAMIAQFGITEERVGAPILSSMATVEIGRTDRGIPVYVDEYAMSAEYIIPVGRIKPHTDFRGPFESGLMKMLAIGLGKQHGANICHKLGMADMSQNVLSIGREIIRTGKVPFGIGIIENAFHGIWKIAGVPSEEFENEEPELLREAKALVPVIPFEKIDVVVCESMGKDISGTGMDSNVIGRSASLGISRPFAERIGVLSLTQKSHGNANGMGVADSISRRFFDDIDMDQTYPNAITSAETTAVKIPAVMDNDRQCVKFLIKTCIGCGEDGLRIVWIKNTQSLDAFYISEGLVGEARQNKDMKIDKDIYELQFDAQGTFAGFCPVHQRIDQKATHI